MIGLVTSSFLERNFVFVRGRDGVNYFLHKENLAVPGPLPEKNQYVSFDPAPNPLHPGKMQATNARILSATDILSGGGGQ